MKKPLPLKAIVVLLFIIGNHSLFSQKFVKVTGTAGTGASWDSPLIGFAGLRLACQSGGTVYVAAGIYTIPSAVTFIQLSQISHTIQGGFPASATGTSIANYNPITNFTNIDGNNNQIFIVSNIVSSSITVSLKGFSLTNAVDNAGDNLSSVFVSDKTLAGGPSLANYSFTDLTITNNRNAFDIGGLSDVSSKVLFKNCYFNNNTSVGLGDCINVVNFGTASTAASSFLIDGCTFTGNHASTFAEVHFSGSNGITVQKSSFCNNNTTSLGGSGIYEENCNTMLVSQCNFRNNGTATNYYGALCLLGNSSSITVDNCVFYNNYINGNMMNIQNCDIKTFNSGYTLSNCGVQGPVTFYAGFTTKTTNVYSSTMDPGSCATTVILPVTGLVLTGQLANGLPLLKWATLTEQNCSYFEVQSSTTGSGFSMIGKITAAGTSNTLLNYSYTDNAATAVVTYYRLAIVDKDGKTNYSNTVAIKLSNPSQTLLGINIFPNPVTNLVNVETGMAGTYQLDLFNTAGQRVQHNQLSSASGLLNLNINRSAVLTGIYVLKITNTDGRYWHRTILVK